ncbi:MAG: hypothetical protein JOZ17_14285 [Acetobacteraceae bacterium]|nr:hypothetical protein [Acetobacteraceae bacterium]
MNCSLRCAEEGADSIRVELADRRKATRLELRKRFKHFQSTGALPTDADVDVLARYVLTVAWGMAVEAQSGASRSDLHRTVKQALASWPT